MVFEGAQGTLLDIDHGTYPFVTSSNPVAGAACVGAGVGPKSIDEVWGISKAYCTRVGAGPFPSELHDEMGDRLREAGHEFGTTTGRARRCGWLDLVALRYAVRVNGLTGLVLTKLDVLTGIDPLPVATGYSGPEGASFDEFPYHQSVLHHVRGETVDLPGWHEDITGARTLEDLPENARAYIALHRGAAGHPRGHRGRGPRARADHLDRGGRIGAAPVGRRQRLDPASGARTTWVLTTMSCSARSVVPQRPEVVQQRRDREEEAADPAEQQALDHELAQDAAGRSRTADRRRGSARMPTICLPEGLAVALARRGP